MTEKGYFRVDDSVVLRGTTQPQLIVTGFRPLYVGRLSGYERMPGVYLDQAHLAVRTAQGVQRRGYYHHTALAHADNAVVEERGPRVSHPKPIRVGNLPNTEFWEGDAVETHDGRLLYVVAIDYALIVTGTATPAPQCKPYVMNPRSWPVKIYKDDTDEDMVGADGEFMAAAELTLLERGNVWRLQRGKEISFRDPKEEITFHLMMGWLDLTEEPTYSLADARGLTEREEVDGFFVTGAHPATQTVHGLWLTRATAELRTEFASLCLAAPDNEPAFLLP